MASSRRSSNDVILQQLTNGTAKFELVNPKFSTAFFARIGPSLGGGGGVSPAMKKLEHYSVHKVAGDGRCMFRALVKGMAKNKGLALSSREETDDADELRMAVKEVICDSDEERHQHEEALIAITVDESLKRYCQRIQRSDFWGGESELLVLSKLCRQPIIVYIPEQEISEEFRENNEEHLDLTSFLNSDSYLDGIAWEKLGQGFYSDCGIWIRVEQKIKEREAEDASSVAV